MNEPRSDAEIAAELNAIFGEPVEGRDYITMPDATIVPRALEEIQAIEAAEQRADAYTAASAALFDALLRKATPGISHIQALANGAHYKAALAVSGITPEEYRRWQRAYTGKSLVVHLDRDGKPGGCHLMPQAAAAAYVADNPAAVVVAVWSVNP